jgi:hypothetical protein
VHLQPSHMSRCIARSGQVAICFVTSAAGSCFVEELLPSDRIAVAAAVAVAVRLDWLVKGGYLSSRLACVRGWALALHRNWAYLSFQLCFHGDRRRRRSGNSHRRRCPTSIYGHLEKVVAGSAQQIDAAESALAALEDVAAADEGARSVCCRPPSTA